MIGSELLNDYRRWQRFQEQDRLGREHGAAVRKLEGSGAMASKLAEAYRSMAGRAAAEGACYRTLFEREQEDGSTLACEGWLFVRRVISEGGTTRVRATMLESFTLEHGRIPPGERPAYSITLELFDQISIQRGMAMSSRVDRQDAAGDIRFVTFVDAVQNYKAHMQA
ncbi:hypothetical protein [Halotalea alkalilenta]|uniref:hypothetical protein n=1 Tax=Halotalea alkalilenta TaxID=376489 RepID=UPI000486B3CE|nr:hypothetical protein [Halotalea alkalilenta]